MKSFLLGVSLLALAACQATTHQDVPFPSQDVEISSKSVSRIYVLRTDEAKGFYRTVEVLQSEGEIGRIGSDSYLCWERPPTRTLLRFVIERVEMVEEKPNVERFVDAQCEPGQTYYYAIAVDSAWGQPHVRQLKPEEAHELLKGLKPPPTKK